MKRTSPPSLTPSLRVARGDLSPQRLFVVHAGAHSFDLSRKVRALAIGDVLDERRPW
ncbi:MAG: hypothetical protein ACF8XB_13725 [Planctomycetota bacterium JB042]